MENQHAYADIVEDKGQVDPGLVALLKIFNDIGLERQNCIETICLPG